MRRFGPLLILAFAGCSTHPIADFLDIVHPAPPVCPQTAPPAPMLPTYPAGTMVPPVTRPSGLGPEMPAAPPPNWPGA
jgi:hypothetical protein